MSDSAMRHDPRFTHWEDEPDFTAQAHPGPYTFGDTDVGELRITIPGGWSWFCGGDMEVAEGEDLMTGQLMAAAPDLLEACKSAVDLLSSTAFYEYEKSAVERLKAAIAKATEVPQ